jgi:hypothetical protein
MSPAASSSEGPAGAAFCPYVGLAPFEENHANYYFGRDVDAANLADNVLFAPITVLFGASGVGKTSLLNVGLLLGLDHQAAVVLFRHWQSSEFRSLLICDIVRAGEMQTINMSKAPRSLPEIASAFTK